MKPTKSYSLFAGGVNSNQGTGTSETRGDKGRAGHDAGQSSASLWVVAWSPLVWWCSEVVAHVSSATRSSNSIPKHRSKPQTRGYLNQHGRVAFLSSGLQLVKLLSKPPVEFHGTTWRQIVILL